MVPTGDTAGDLLSAVYEQLGIGSVTAGFRDEQALTLSQAVSLQPELAPN